MTVEDKRYLPRWKVNNRIQYKVENESLIRECLSKDISCSGACIFSSDHVPRDRKLKLRIYLSQRTSIEVCGKVLWSQQSQDGYVLGVNFFNLSEEDQNTILKYAFEVKKDDVVNNFFKGWKNC